MVKTTFVTNLKTEYGNRKNLRKEIYKGVGMYKKRKPGG